MSKSKPYEYFDTPDGQDVLKKLMIVLKPTAITGVGLSTADVMLVSRPKGYLATVGRYAYITLPLLGMSTAFVIVSSLANSFRKKDDQLNWALGGLAAGGILGAWRKNVVAGWVGGAAMAALLSGKKYAHMTGFKILPDKIVTAHGGVRSVKHDYTLVKDNPGAWRKV